MTDPKYGQTTIWKRIILLTVISPQVGLVVALTLLPSVHLLTSEGLLPSFMNQVTYMFVLWIVIAIIARQDRLN